MSDSYPNLKVGDGPRGRYHSNWGIQKMENMEIFQKLLVFENVLKSKTEIKFDF